MKGIAKIIALAALWMPLAGVAEDAAPDTPQDYAWGMQLNSEGASPFWQVGLPTQVYEQTVWPDLRDVRVFNKQGEAVPFALQPQQRQQDAPKPVAMKVFPLDIKHTKQDGQSSVKVTMPNGAELNFDGDDATRIKQSFLLTLPDGLKTPVSMSQLRVNWQKMPQNWQAKVDLFYGDDLKNWHALSEDAPLVDLTAGNDRLRLDTLKAAVTLSEDGPRYLLMTVSDTPQPLILDGVDALIPGDYVGDTYVYLPAHSESIGVNETVYSWANPQPLLALALNPARENQVLPVDIEYRQRTDEPWRPLAKTVLYRMSDVQSEPVMLQGELIQAIRVKGINVKWGDMPPEVQGLRESQTLVFNAQGSGPFMMAWGNRAAKPQVLAFDTLIPEPLRAQYGIERLPVATEADSVTLGGEARLTAVNPAERRSQWMTALIWGVLVVGVFALLWVAFRLWREVRENP